MGATQPGSAREEAERLVAAVLGAARLATAGAGERTSGFGTFGDMISSVLGHTGGLGPADTRGATGTRGPASEPTAAATASGFATGTAECCVCPICRAISALRDPSPEFTERLATGASDLAAGVASLLRAFSSGSGPSEPSWASPSDPASSGASGPADPGTSDPPGPDAPTDQPSGWTVQDDEVWREATRTGHDSGPAPERDVWAKATYVDANTRPTVPASRAPGELVNAEEDVPGDGA